MSASKEEDELETRCTLLTLATSIAFARALHQHHSRWGKRDSHRRVQSGISRYLFYLLMLLLFCSIELEQNKNETRTIEQRRAGAGTRVIIEGRSCVSQAPTVDPIWLSALP